jgi:uncharacterized protein
MYLSGSMMSCESLSGSPVRCRFNLSSLLQQPVGSSVDCTIEDLVQTESPDSVSGTIHLTHTSRGVALSGEGVARVCTPCMRCLQEYCEDVHFVIEEQVHPDPHFAHRRGAEGFEEEDDVSIRADNTLDLGEIIRQHIVLHLPLKPLCRPDCPGIEEIHPDV